jgi:hypothetical protein
MWHLPVAEADLPGSVFLPMSDFEIWWCQTFSQESFHGPYFWPGQGLIEPRKSGGRCSLCPCSQFDWRIFRPLMRMGGVEYDTCIQWETGIMTACCILWSVWFSRKSAFWISIFFLVFWFLGKRTLPSCRSIWPVSNEAHLQNWSIWHVMTYGRFDGYGNANW